MLIPFLINSLYHVGLTFVSGYRFALMQVKAGIAAVISNFRLLPNKRTPVPIIPDPTYFILGAKGGLWLDLEKRTDK